MRSAASTNRTDELTDARRPEFAAVAAAFERFEVGDDAGAIAAIGVVGVTSPLAPWKLMLRGLIAWHGGDDARAKDNWQRLPAGGEPARLIAPLLAEIDPAYRQSLPSPERATLRRRYKALVSVNLAGSLQALHGQFGQRPPGQIVERARPLLAPLHRLLPEGPARLTAALSRLLCEQGHPSDVPVLAAQFPPPTDDPRFDLLRAHVAESVERFPEAVTAWRDYDTTLAERPALLGTDTGRARGHVWLRIAKLEWEASRARRGKRSAEKPDPKASAMKALEFAPDLRPAWRLLFDMAVASGRSTSILKTGRELLRHDPHCDYTLATLARVCRDKAKPDEALDYSRQLYEHSPLNAAYRQLYARDVRSLARRQLRRGDSTGLALLDRAVALDPESAASAHAVRAAHAIRTGQSQAAELHIAQAGQHPAAIALRMLGEAAYFDLPDLSRRFTATVKKTLAGPSTVPVCVALCDVLADQLRDRLAFPGKEEMTQGVLKKVYIAGKKAGAADLPGLFSSARRAGFAFTLIRLFIEIEHKHKKDPRLPFEVALAIMEDRSEQPFRAGRYARKAHERLKALSPEQRPIGMEQALEEMFGPLLRERDEYDDVDQF